MSRAILSMHLVRRIKALGPVEGARDQPQRLGATGAGGVPDAVGSVRVFK